MNRIQKAKRNVIYGFISKIVINLINFIVRTAFIKILGSEYLGLNGIFYNILQCLSLAELGLNQVVIYKYFEPLAKKDYNKVKALNNFYKPLYKKISIVIFVIGICIVPFLNYLIDTKIPIQSVYALYLLFLIDTSLSYLFVYKTSVLYADQNNYIASLIDTIAHIFKSLVQLIVLFKCKNYFLYLTINILFNVLSNYLKAYIVESKYDLKGFDGSISDNEVKEINAFIKSGFIYKISNVLLNSTDNIMVSMICGMIWVGYLMNYNDLISLVTIFVVVIYSNISSTIGNLVVLESPEISYKIYKQLEYVSRWLAAILSLSFILLCDDFVRLWIGDEYVLSLYAKIPLGIKMYITLSLQALASYREALGLFNRIKTMMFASSVLNIVLSLILGLLYGLPGILWATIISMVMTYFWYEPIILFRDYFKKGAGEYFVSFFLDLIKTITCFFIAYSISEFIVVNTIFMWFFKAILVFGCVNIMYFILSKNNSYFKDMMKMVIKRNGNHINSVR